MGVPKKIFSSSTFQYSYLAMTFEMLFNLANWFEIILIKMFKNKLNLYKIKIS